MVLVKDQNLVKYLSPNLDPRRREISVADTPELALAFVGFTPHVQQTSTSSTMLVDYELLITSGSKVLDEKMFPVIWETYVAMSRWDQQLLATTFDGNPFVRKAVPTSAVIGLEDLASNRGIKGWSAIWSGQVELVFNTEVLRTVEAFTA